MATQVDYVELIVSRNTEDFRRDKVVPHIEFTPNISIKEPTIIEDVMADSHMISPRRPYTVQSQSQSIENSSIAILLNFFNLHKTKFYIFFKDFSKRVRMRLDSAPSSINKDNSMTDYSGVNMVGFFDLFLFLKVCIIVLINFF